MLTVAQLEEKFSQLTDITDRVAMINSRYDSDLDGALTEMEEFIEDAMQWDVEQLTAEARLNYLSQVSFHREVIAEIIADARRLLIDERREQVKRLVAYHKNFSRWCNKVEKLFAA
ncbi:MAG: PLU-1-like domain protein [Spirochaetales bacterium]|nr:PLU-1-like domain protein [Spirochaetales bacterium]